MSIVLLGSTSGSITLQEPAVAGTTVTINATQSRIVVLALNNAGTIELAVVNISGGTQLDETNLISTTAEGGAGGADSASVVYSTTARTSLAYRVIGYIESTQATAGTWATAPSTIQGVGGQALNAMSSLGYGQTWQSVTRVSGTTYYNTTGKPIEAIVTGSSSGANTIITAIVNGVGPITIASDSLRSADSRDAGSIIIQVGASYSFTSTSTLTVFELR
jgi:hypothetical protein